MLRGSGIAGLALAVGVVAAAAQEMKRPQISPAQVDWEAVVAELDDAGSLGLDRLAALNLATGTRFANVAASPVPVLLPFDTAALLHDREAAAAAADAASGPERDYLVGASAVPFFYPGPAGYDAVVVAGAEEKRALGIGYSRPIHIHIGGSALLYEVNAPVGMIGWPVRGLDEIPGIRRSFLENNVRYTFVRYGVPYVVSIECSDAGARLRRMSCRDADKVAVRFLKSLRVVGGMPHPQAVAADTIDRPAAQSTVFTFLSPGNLLPGTGFRRKGGVADYTVYSKMRFPLADAPAFANSQSFMNWGNCEATGRSGAGRLGGVAAYRCRVNGKTLVSDESAADNYSYPWRDNFCETRNFYVGQCPGGLGHQGQDIRPAFCKQRIQGANRCEPYLHEVVAARDGAVLRSHGQEALYLVVNAPGERIRMRYLHMSPKQIDADGMVSGRQVREGEVIGKVGNFFERERATTYHLHFDLQVPTKYGWVFVNPYMTLVAAYERLIRGRGQEIREGIPEPREQEIREDIPVGSVPAPPAVVAAPALAPEPEMPAKMAAKQTETLVESPPGQIESGTRRDERSDETSLVTAGVPAAPGGGGVEHDGARAEQQGVVRPMGRGFSRPGPRAWHIRRDLHEGDDQHQAGHGGI